MKYRVNAPGFPVGQFLIPPGTIIDSSLVNDTYSKLALAHSIPLNVTALDDEAVKALAVQQERQKRGG